MRIFLFLFVIGSLGAGTWTVQSGSCSDPRSCFAPVTPANIQAAINAASCGDTIQIEAGQVASIKSAADAIYFSKACPVGQEVVITTTKAAWLPDPRDRMLPSYRPLLPTISLDGPIRNNAAILLTSRSPVPSGVKLIGVYFRQGAGYSITDAGNIYSYWAYIGDPNQTASDTPAIFPDNVTFDRTLFYGTYEPNKSFASVMLLNATNFTFENSYVGGMNGITRANANGGYDTTVLRTGTGAGPLTIKNNFFCCGWTEGFLTGGNFKSFGNGSPTVRNIDYEHNVQVNALRFLPGTSTFIGTQNRPMIKNCYELKEGMDSLFRWNTCVNSWANDFSQWFGAKMSDYNESYPRGYYNGYGVGATNAGATLSAGDNGPNSRVSIGPTTGHIWALRTGAAIGIATVAGPNESIYFTNGQWEYHIITRVEDAAQNIYQMDHGYTHVSTTTNAPWMVVTNPWTSTQRVVMENNVYRNVATALELDGGDTADCGIPITDFTFRNNLQLIDSPQANFGAVSIQPSLVKMTYGGTRLTIDHNETVILPAAHSSAQKLNSIFQLDNGSGRQWVALRVRSNLGGHTEYAGPTGSTLASAADPTLQWINNSYLGSDYNGNGANPYGVTNHCAAGQSCKNIWGTQGNVNVDYRFNYPAANDFSIRPDSVAICGATNATPIVLRTCSPHNFLPGQPVRIQEVGGNSAANGVRYVKTVVDSTHFSLRDEYTNDVAGNGAYTSGGTAQFALSQGGHDGADVGVDTENIPLIRHLTATPMAHSVLFQWTVPRGMVLRGARESTHGQQQPRGSGTPDSSVGCQIEVSPDAGLLNDDADYSVVNALRPDYFLRADSDRYDPRATVSPSGQVRWFQVGDPSSATGDDGQSHDLSLTASTTYYYRLFCGGAMERGSFTTKAGDSGASSVTVQVPAVAPRVTQVRARYGPTAGSLTVGSAVPCASGCSITVPATSGRQVVVYLDELDSQNNMVAQPPPTVLAVP